MYGSRQVPPAGVVLPDGSRPFGDDIATRSPFANGGASVRIPCGLVDDGIRGGVSAVVAILVREGGGDDEWLHADDGGALRAPVGVPPPGGSGKTLISTRIPKP